jgi:hypothetical protein
VGHRPKPSTPVPRILAVPIWVVGVIPCRWVRRRRLMKRRRWWCWWRSRHIGSSSGSRMRKQPVIRLLLHSSFPVLGQFLNLRHHKLHRRLNCRFPCLKSLGRLLKRIHPLILLQSHCGDSRFPLGVVICELLVDLSLLVSEFLTHLLEEQFGIRIHRSQLLLQPSIMGIGRRIQARM